MTRNPVKSWNLVQKLGQDFRISPNLPAAKKMTQNALSAVLSQQDRN
jgi:hypothetical protein